MNLQDGVYFSPDCGSFEVKDGTYYFEDGSTRSAEVAKEYVMRITPYLPGSLDQNFKLALLSDRERESLRGEWKLKRAKWKRQEKERIKLHNRLIKSAKSKLTEEEFNAVLLEGRYS